MPLALAKYASTGRFIGFCSETEARQRIVEEAQTWVGTPYIDCQMVKGRRGGVDCAMLLVGVYGNVGLIPKDFDPRPYPAQWHINKNEEKYLGHIFPFAKEVPGPPQRAPRPGDVVMFKISLAFAHGGIVTDWPNIIHANGGPTVPEDISKNTTGKRALALMPQRFFSLWN
jgi:cell wall-associated NlpC family hydrolase